MTTTPHPTLEELSVEECRRLLTQVPVGRIAFNRQDQPLVLPVNFAVDDDAVVFRTRKGSKLDVAEREAGVRVAFEVDHYDEDSRTGWSVLATGRMRPVLDLTETARLDRLGLHAWADDLDRQRWIRVEIDRLSGRRVTTPA